MNHLSLFSVFPFILRPSQCSYRVSQSFLRSIQDIPRGCLSPSLKVSSTSEGTYVRTDFHMDGLMGRYVRPYPDLWKLSSIMLCVLRQIVPFGVARQMGKKGGGSYERIEGGGSELANWTHAKGKQKTNKRQSACDKIGFSVIEFLCRGRIGGGGNFRDPNLEAGQKGDVYMYTYI